MKLHDVEESWRALLLGSEERLMPDVEPARQRVYRRLVRSNLMQNCRRAIPISRKLVGDDVVDGWIARFLDEQGPRTRLVRHIPSELAEWLLAQPVESLPHAAAAELVHWEVLEVEVALAPDHEGPGYPRVPTPSSRIETHPSARLAAYQHGVHALSSSSTHYPPRSPMPVILLAWRGGERFVWQRLMGGTAKVLVECAQGKTIGDAFVAVEQSLVDGDVLERPRVMADLVDLCRRGAIVGFPPAHAAQ
jgi:hypothetical protein